ncbi:uncharacterized protein AAEQ78_001422 [Lycaon pictus]
MWGCTSLKACSDDASSPEAPGTDCPVGIEARCRPVTDKATPPAIVGIPETPSCWWGLVGDEVSRKMNGVITTWDTEFLTAEGKLTEESQRFSIDQVLGLTMQIYSTERGRAQAGRVAGRGRGRNRFPMEQGACCEAPFQNLKIKI